MADRLSFLPVDGHTGVLLLKLREFRSGQITRMRTVLNRPPSRHFSPQRNGRADGHQSQLLDLARANGQIATMINVGKLLADIRASTTKTGGAFDLTDPSLQRLRSNDNQVTGIT
jgi:hypothetical protein